MLRMRDSYFADQISAVLQGLREGDEGDRGLTEVLTLIEKRLVTLLDDEMSPERQWRQQVAEPLSTLANVLRVTGRPVPSVEALASELSY